MMPELPEVETIRRGITSQLIGQQISKVVIRQPQLRWPVPEILTTRLPRRIVQQVARRAKYLLLCTDSGTVILHLGMTGRLQVLTNETPPSRHDHVDIAFTNGRILRFNDSRRFGAVLWTEGPLEQHPLLHSLGPEPLEADFSGTWLYQRAQGRILVVKSFLMDHRVVAGMGNIYANESLFAARIDPRRAAGRITLAEYDRLALTIQEILAEALRYGGTTVRDFVDGNGKQGHFAPRLRVYGRYQLPCTVCGTSIARCRLGQRSTYYCPQCQS